MNGRYLLNANGEPEPCENLIEWARRIDQQRRVALDELPNATVSTVFLGLDHAFGGQVPILYETMIFGGKLDGEEARYATRGEALAGHAVMVEKARTA